MPPPPPLSLHPPGPYAFGVFNGVPSLGAGTELALRAWGFPDVDREGYASWDFTTALTAYGAGDDDAAADANASVVPLLGSSAYGGGDGGAAGWSAASLAFETAVEGMLAWLTTTTASSDAFCASPWNCRFFFFFFPFFCASP